jgi:flagellin-like protein
VRPRLPVNVTRKDELDGSAGGFYSRGEPSPKMQIHGSYKLNNKLETSLSKKKVNSLTHKFLKSKKGISPILATLLLVVIAVAAIVVTYAWVMTYTGHLTGQAGVVLYQSNVNFYGNGSKIDIDIGNSGTSDTTIIQVYIGTSSSSMNKQTITPVSLPAGSVQRITVNYSWQVGVTYYFKVTTSSGQTLPWYQQAPSTYS